MATCRFHLQPAGLVEENGVISLNEHADSLEMIFLLLLLFLTLGRYIPEGV